MADTEAGPISLSIKRMEGLLKKHNAGFKRLAVRASPHAHATAG